MIEKIEKSEEINELFGLILKISNDINNIKNKLDLITCKVQNLEEKISGKNILSYESLRGRSLDPEISIGRMKDD